MSCLFDSLSHFIENENSQNIRKIIVDYLASNPNIIDDISFEEIMSWENQNVNNYLSLMNQNETWGGAIEIKAFVNIYKIHVFVHIPNIQRIVEFLYHDIENTDKIVHIIWTGNHFMPLTLEVLKKN